MAKNLKPCAFIVKTGGEAIGSPLDFNSLSEDQLRNIGFSKKESKEIASGDEKIVFNRYYNKSSLRLEPMTRYFGKSKKELLKLLSGIGYDEVDFNEQWEKQNSDDDPKYTIQVIGEYDTGNPDELGEFYTEAAAKRAFERADERQEGSEDQENVIRLVKINNDGEYEDVDTKYIPAINDATREILYDVQKEFGGKYTNIELPNGKILNLRIADHSANRRNNTGDRNLSIVISNLNPTERFRGEMDKMHPNEIIVNSSLTEDEIVAQINEAIDKVKEQEKTGGEALSSAEESAKEISKYKGIFNPNKTGVPAIDDLLEDDGYQFFYKGVKADRVLMSPNEYLERVRKGLKTKTDANILAGKTDAIKKAIESGAKINAPFISTIGGKFSQEGRNRAVVAKELGEQKIPVFIESDVTFDDKINRGAELVKQSQEKGNKTKEDVLDGINKLGLHRDGIRFIGDNYDAIEEKSSKLGTGKELRLSYDEMRQYLFDNPQLWQEGKAERRKIGATPEQKLKQAFDKWKAEYNKMGIVPNWDKQVKADVELFKAIGTYLAKKLEQGAYSFEQFINDLGKTKVEKINEQKANWKGFYDDAVSKAKTQEPPVAATPPPPAKPPVTPPATEGTELPEAPKGQVPKKVVERRYKADSPEMKQALEEIGIFRTPGNIEEAQKKASQLVAQVGVDAALEVARKESIDGLYKIGIMGAVLEDIENRRAATNDPEEFVRLTNEAAAVTDEASNYLTTAGQELRMWQEILRGKDLPFEYEGRKQAFIEQFGAEAFTKEVQERFESLNKQYQEALSKINDLEQEKAKWERQSLIDDIANEKKEEPAARKSFFKEAAARVRKLIVSKPGIFSSATPASLAWDASIEAVAIALEGLGTLEIAIGKGVDKLRSTEWYRNLSQSKKDQAEKAFRDEVEKAYIPTVSVDENGKVVIPQGALKAYVESGYRDAEEIVDNIYDQLINDNPNLTKRDVRDAISGYGRKYNPTPNQVRDQINEIKAIGKLISAIEDAENGIEKTTNPKTKKQISDRLKALKEQYKAAYMNSFGRKPTQRTEQEKLEGLQQRLKDLEEGKKKSKEPNAPDSPEAKALKERIRQFEKLKRLQDELKDLQEGKTKEKKERKEDTPEEKALKEQIKAQKESMGITEAARYATVKRNMEKEIERLRAMKPRPERRPPINYDAQLEALATEKLRLQEEWDAEFSKEEQKQKGIGTIIGDVAYGGTQISKSVMAGGLDLGTLLIHGSMLSTSDLSTTKQAAKNLVKSLLSEKEYQKEIGKIRNSELYRIIRKSGLDLTIPFGKTLLAEEAGADTLAEQLFNLLITPLKYIPEYGPKAYDFAKRFNFIRALNRAQTAYMNTLRVGNFLIDVQNMQEKGITFYNNPQAYKDVAAAINTLSGRGGLFGAENSKIVMRGLNIAFFAPKNWSSILRLFTPLLLVEIGSKRAGADPYKMSVAQARIIKTWAKYVAGTSLGILGIAALSGDDEDDEEKKEKGNVSVDLKNPQSSAFGKIRIGNQIFDPWGGKMQIITLQSRLLIHAMGGYAYKDPFTGIEKKLQDSYFKTPGNLMGEYVKGKFAPSLRAPWQLWNSVPVPGRPGYYRPVEGGKEFYLFEPFKESFENLTIQALKETYGEQPLSVAEIATLMIIAGGGVTTLNDQEDITTVTKIRNLLSPGDDEVKKFKKAFSNYLKSGDVDMAEQVFDKATGSYQLQQTIQQQQEEGKSVGDVQRQLARKRKQSVKDLFEGIIEDNLVQKYSFEKRYRDEIVDAVYNDKLLPTSGMSEKKQQMFERINALTPEMKEDIKRNYDFQYEELMTVAKGLDRVAERADSYYEKKAKRTPWVKQYLRLTGKEEKQ